MRLHTILPEFQVVTQFSRIIDSRHLLAVGALLMEVILLTHNLHRCIRAASTDGSWQLIGMVRTLTVHSRRESGATIYRPPPTHGSSRFVFHPT